MIDVLDVHRLETTEKKTNRLSIGILFTVNLKADTMAPQNHTLDQKNVYFNRLPLITECCEDYFLEKLDGLVMRRV